MEQHVNIVPQFREMRAQDISQIADIEKICFISPWSKHMITSELKNKYASYHVLEEKDKIIGYAGMWILFTEAHITNVAILPDYRRKGYALNMMLMVMDAAIKKGAEEMTLEVRESNFGAQALYNKLGFEKVGTRKKYYSDTGENAYIYWNRDIIETTNRLLLKQQGDIIT